MYIHYTSQVNYFFILIDGTEEGLTSEKWASLHVDGVVADEAEVHRLVYFGGVQHDIRKEVWPYLLGHYSFGTTQEERKELDEATRHYYETTMSEWLAVEAIVRQRDKEKTAHAVAKLSSESGSGDKTKGLVMDGEMENDVFEENGYSDISDHEGGYDDDDSVAKKRKGSKNISRRESEATPSSPQIKIDEKFIEDEMKTPTENLEDLKLTENCFGETTKELIEISSNKSSPSTSSYVSVANEFGETSDIASGNITPSDKIHSVIITDASIDIVNMPTEDDAGDKARKMESLREEGANTSLDALQEPRSACVSPASSNGGIYSVSFGFLVSGLTTNNIFECVFRANCLSCLVLICIGLKKMFKGVIGIIGILQMRIWIN